MKRLKVDVYQIARGLNRFKSQTILAQGYCETCLNRTCFRSFVRFALVASGEREERMEFFFDRFFCCELLFCVLLVTAIVRYM